MYDPLVKAIAGPLLAVGILLSHGCGGSHGGKNQPGTAGDSSIAGSGGVGGSAGSGASGGSGGRGGSGGWGGMPVDAGGDGPSSGGDARADSGGGGSGRCQKTTFATGSATLPVSLIDVSGDHVPDLIVPEGVLVAPAHIAVAVADGAGSFNQPTPWLDAQVATKLFAGADFDADGKVDVVGLSDYGALQLFRGAGNGQLAPAITITTLSQYGESLAVADFNGDGRPDIAAGASTPGAPGRVEVFLGQGDGTFRTSIVTTIGQLQTAVTLLPDDFDEDGHEDLLVYAAAQAGGQALVFLGHGDGSFSTQQIFSLVNITGLATGDLNKDGHADLVASYGNNYLTVQLGAGNGTFSGVSGLRPNTKAQSNLVIIADVSGDGAADVIVGNSLPDTMSILVGHGDGTFDDGIIIPLDVNADWIRAGDLNRDGVADLVTVNNTDGADIYLGPCP
jgi:hypothetical protein